MKNKVMLAAIFGAMCFIAGSCNNAPGEADLLITGGTVYDGVNDTPLTADIAVDGDRIVYIGEARADITSKCKAVKVIDASGCVVCPGFIDPHNHQEKILLEEKACESYLRMGVTSMIPGQCGGSNYPIGEFFARMEEQGIGVNVASFTGHNTIREQVMGSEDRFATDEEIKQMQELFAKELEEGSLGLSTGLYYVPGCFSEEREVVELCRTMSDKGGIYTTHVRNENKDGIGLYNSIVEALEIGRKADVQVNISHIKCLGKSVWHRSDSVINIIEQYQNDGLKVTADQYPYLASGLRMASALTPSWARDGGVAGLRERFKNPELLARIKAEIPDMIYERGGAETIYISKDAGEYSEMTLAEAAAKLKMDPVDAVVYLCTEYKPYLNTFVACDEDLENYMKKPWVMTCTDGTFGSHPRAAGTYAEKIQKYVVEKNIISLPEMIRKSTSLVAETYRIADRGELRKGAYADIIVFKPEEVKANATYAEPKLFATGFRSVVVNGVVAVENDVYTGSLSGKVIRRNNSK